MSVQHHNSSHDHDGTTLYSPPGCSEEVFRQRIRQRLDAVLRDLAQKSREHGQPLPPFPARLESGVFARACADCRGQVPAHARDIYQDELQQSGILQSIKGA